LGVPVALTCRSEEPVNATVAGWLDRLQRNPRVRRLDLPSFSEAETAEQIELLLGARPPRRLVADTFARSESNAFFTEQLVAASATGEDHELPAGLTSLLLSRTGHVTGTGREILAVLAVAARPLNEPTLALLCQRPVRDVRDALRDLRARWLLRRPDDAGRRKTNSEIGAALFISRKTASVHVTNILRKLGVTTRVQAAAVAERAGLLLAD
jgi:predicted ATPase